MVKIRALAPTLMDALQAVELGCRKIQNDPQFVPEMTTWMTIVTPDICVGCLATSTLMQLVNKTGKDILDCFSPFTFSKAKAVSDRSTVLEIEEGPQTAGFSEFSFFECAIDSLRHSELFPLLQFYGLEKHPNARAAVKWLFGYQSHSFGYSTTKNNLLQYADFIKDKLIPKVRVLFY